ncbi:MAG TPA: flagellar biosynthesis protein FliQ [Methylocella sp.]|nr:flagellar biosynthesis protein FliQ [Methylocella sp.]
MNEADALELLRSAIWTILAGSGPAVAAAMLAGLAIALFQALTQIQEVTLSFVPKIIAIFIALLFGAPFIGSQLQTFTALVYARIASGF